MLNLYRARGLWATVAAAVAIGVAAPLALVGELAGCRGCGSAARPAPLIAMADPAKDAVVWLPSLARALSNFDAFTRGLTGAGQPTLNALRERAQASLTTELGRNILDPKVIAAMGIEPGQGLLAWLPGDPRQPVFAVAVADAARLEAAVADLARRRSGADQTQRISRHGTEVISFGRPAEGGMAPVLHLAFVREGDQKRALWATGDGLEALATALAPPPDAEAGRSQARADDWAKQLAQLPTGDIYVAQPGHGVVALTLSGEGMTGDARWRAPDLAAGILGAAPPRPALAWLPQDALWAACGALSPQLWASGLDGGGASRLAQLPGPLARLLAQRLAQAASDPQVTAVVAQLVGAWAASIDPAAPGGGRAAGGGLAQMAMRWVQHVSIAEVADSAQILPPLLALEARWRGEGRVGPCRLAPSPGNPNEALGLHELPLPGRPVWALASGHLLMGAPDAAVAAAADRLAAHLLHPTAGARSALGLAKANTPGSAVSDEASGAAAHTAGDAAPETAVGAGPETADSALASTSDALADSLATGPAAAYLEKQGWLSVLRGGHIADALARGQAGQAAPGGLGGVVEAAAALLRCLGDVAVHVAEEDGALRAGLRQRLLPAAP